jgi:hypothetical protein
MLRLVPFVALVTAASFAHAAPACPTIKTWKQDFCFPRSADPLTRFEVCGNTALVCTGGMDTEVGCAAVDLASGAFHQAIAPRPRIARARIEARGGKVQLCRGKRCVATDLPELEDPYQLSLSANEKRAVVTTEFGLAQDVVVLDTATGKRAQTISIPAGKADLMGPAYFLGDAIFVLVGQWPLERGWLITNGKARKLDDRPLGRGQPIALGRDRWAIPTYGGDLVVVLETKSATLTASPGSPSDAGACHRCFVNSQDPTFEAMRLGRSGSGALVLVSVLGIAMVDPTTLATRKTWKLPVCPAPPPGRGGN